MQSPSQCRFGHLQALSKGQHPLHRTSAAVSLIQSVHEITKYLHILHAPGSSKVRMSQALLALPLTLFAATRTGLIMAMHHAALKWHLPLNP